MTSVVSVLACLALAACGSSSESAPPAESSAKQPISLKVGALAVLGNVPVFLAKEKGFFSDEGLDVEITTDVSNPANAVPAILSGELDMITTNIPSYLQGAAKGLAVKAISEVSSDSDTYTGLYVTENSPIKSIADLAGKKVGLLAHGGIQDIGLQNAAIKAGIDPKSIELVELPAPATAAALKEGKVDAASLVEPFITLGGAGLRRIGAEITEGIGPKTLITAIMTSDKLIADNPTAVQAFARAMDRAQAYAADHLDEVRSIMASISQTPPDVLAKVGMPTFSTNASLQTLRDQIQVQAQAMVNVGQLTTMPDVDSLVYGG